MAAEPMPTATPALTSLVRRSSSALSSSSLIGGFLWPSAALGKRHERALQGVSRAEGRAGPRVRPASACRAVGFRGYRQDASPDRASPSPAAPGGAAGV